MWPSSWTRRTRSSTTSGAWPWPCRSASPRRWTSLPGDRAGPDDGWGRVVLGLLLVEDDRVEEAAGSSAGARDRPADVEAQVLAALAVSAAGYEDRRGSSSSGAASTRPAPTRPSWWRPRSAWRRARSRRPTSWRSCCRGSPGAAHDPAVTPVRHGHPQHPLPSGQRPRRPSTRTTPFPLVSVNVRYHVGSMDERPGRTGFAHLFEHLMFKGSGHVPDGNFDLLLEAAGGWSNGFTSRTGRSTSRRRRPNCLETGALDRGGPHGRPPRRHDPGEARTTSATSSNERRQSYENRPYGMARSPPRAPLPPKDPLSLARHRLHGRSEAATLGDVRDFFETLVRAGQRDPGHRRRHRRRSARALAEPGSGPPPRTRGPEVVRPGEGLARSAALTLEDDVALPRLYLRGGADPVTGADATMSPGGGPHGGSLRLTAAWSTRSGSPRT